MFLLSEIVWDIIDKADKITTGTMLLLIVVGAFRGWWVTGATHKRVLAERDHLQERFEKMLNGRAE